MWFVETRAGTFSIRFVPVERGVFVLQIDGRELGTYFSPEAAAADVFLQSTGFDPWDFEADVSPPSDLDEWTRIDCAAWDSGIVCLE